MKITEKHQELALVANAYARCGVSASAAWLWCSWMTRREGGKQMEQPFPTD